MASLIPANGSKEEGHGSTVRRGTVMDRMKLVHTERIATPLLGSSSLYGGSPLFSLNIDGTARSFVRRSRQAERESLISPQWALLTAESVV